jgi:hypothetical protein
MTYKHQGKLYILLYEGRMKLPSGVWINSIIYKSLVSEDKVENYFAMPRVDFFNDFKPVENAIKSA